MSFRENYKAIFSENRLERFSSDDLASEFETLTDLLLRANAAMNLTAIVKEEEIILKHYADCLASEELIPKGAKLLDVGCGGGFPTLPLAIARRDLAITSLDSTAKKLEFVKKCAAELDLKVKTLAARAEEAARTPAYREKFDAVTARAVAGLPILAEWCVPFVKVGGVFLAMKGQSGKEELANARNAIRLLGGEVEKVEEFTLGDACRCNILVRKISPTPALYPRNNSVIKRKPL